MSLIVLRNIKIFVDLTVFFPHYYQFLKCELNTNPIRRVIDFREKVKLVKHRYFELLSNVVYTFPKPKSRLGTYGEITPTQAIFTKFC